MGAALNNEENKTVAVVSDINGQGVSVYKFRRDIFAVTGISASIQRIAESFHILYSVNQAHTNVIAEYN